MDLDLVKVLILETGSQNQMLMPKQAQMQVPERMETGSQVQVMISVLI